MSDHPTFHPAFAVTARSGLTAGAVRTWSEATAPGPRLLVPVDLQALVVPQGTTADHADVAVTLLGASLSMTAPRAPAPFTNATPRGPGAYLHWALPDGLTQARPTATGAARWRPLPNRWVVTRYLASLPHPVRSWLIEADAGQAFDLDAWAEGGAAQPLQPPLTPDLAPEELTAVVGGDPAWAAVYDNVAFRFAFHDDWAGLAPAQLAGVMTYTVAGWYSRPELDPLHDPDGPDGADGFQELLRQLGWSVDTERLAAARQAMDEAERAARRVGLGSAADPPQAPRALGGLAPAGSVVQHDPRPWWPRQSLYHGVVYGLRADGGGPPDRRPSPAALQAAVGPTSTGALAALVAARLGDADAELFQAAFSYGLADALGDPDGVPRIEQELHARAFESKPGGERTETVAAGDPFGTIRPTTPPTPASTAALAAFDRDVPRFSFVGGGSRVADLLTLTTAPERVAPAPGPRRFEQAVRPLPRWFAPQDPVVVIGGLRRSLRHGFDGRFTPDERLACRLSGDTVTRLRGVVDGRVLLERGIDNGGVPPDAGALLVEAAVEDPFLDISEQVAGRLGIPYGAVSLTLTAEGRLFLWSLAQPADAEPLQALSLKDGVGGSPAGVTIWRPAWVPLYLEWELEHDFGGEAAGWGLEELDYQPPAGVTFTPGATRLAGRSLLVSASAKALADQVSAFLAAEDKLDLAGEGALDEALEARLRTLSREAGQVDLLAAGLDGLRLRLLGFTEETARGAAGADLDDPAPTEPLQALRAGHARLTGLRVVDAFGRSVALVGVPGSAAPAVTVARGLRPASQALAQSGAMVVRPRLNQPARLLLRLVDAADDAVEATIDQSRPEPVSPVAGWLLADHADGAVEFFSAGGEPLGQLLHDALTDAVVWEGPPADRGPVGATPAASMSGGGPVRHLRALASALVEQDALERASGANRSDSPLRALLRVIDTTAETVGLGGATGVEHVAQLVGRPIAVVRATLRLDVEPEPTFAGMPQARRAARAEAWAALARRVFPVRLGALTRLDDGLLGFWAGDDYSLLRPVHGSVLTEAADGGRHTGDLGPVAGAGMRTRPIDSPYVGATPEVGVRPGTMVTLTLLMDPAAKVHATCGLLPRKEIGLLRDWVAGSLERIVPSFRVGPVLVDPTTIRMPMPAALGRRQQWSRRESPTDWRDDPIVAATQQALLPETAAVAQEGYLRVAAEQEAQP
jgi:hypothetical protein